jgi:hypothetical protein
MLALIGVWGFRIFDFVFGDKTSFGLVRAFPVYHYDVLLLVFLVLHHIRMYLGTVFSAYDETFREARTKVPPGRRIANAWIERWVIGNTLVVSAALPYFLPYRAPWPALGLLALQALALFCFARAFHAELFVHDREKSFNKVIIWNDRAFMAFVALSLIYVVGGTINPVFLNSWPAHFVAISIEWIGVLYVGIFVVFEVGLGYWASIREALRTGLWFSISHFRDWTLLYRCQRPMCDACERQRLCEYP